MIFHGTLTLLLLMGSAVFAVPNKRGKANASMEQREIPHTKILMNTLPSCARTCLYATRAPFDVDKVKGHELCYIYLRNYGWWTYTKLVPCVVSECGLGSASFQPQAEGIQKWMEQACSGSLDMPGLDDFLSDRRNPQANGTKRGDD